MVDSLKEIRRSQFLAELLDQLQDPVHVRLVKAFEGDEPVQSMEEELKRIILEILNYEN